MLLLRSSYYRRVCAALALTLVAWFHTGASVQGQDSTVLAVHSADSIITTTVGLPLTSHSQREMWFGAIVNDQAQRAYVVHDIADYSTWQRHDVEGLVSVLDVRTDKVLRVTPIGANPFAWIVSEQLNRLLYVATYGSINNPYVAPTNAGPYIFIFDATSGRLIHTIHLSNQSVEGIAVDERTDHLFIGSFDGLSMYDGQTGRFLRRINSARGTLVAVDEQYSGPRNLDNEMRLKT